MGGGASAEHPVERRLPVAVGLAGAAEDEIDVEGLAKPALAASPTARGDRRRVVLAAEAGAARAATIDCTPNDSRFTPAAR